MHDKQRDNRTNNYNQRTQIIVLNVTKKAEQTNKIKFTQLQCLYYYLNILLFYCLNTIIMKHYNTIIMKHYSQAAIRRNFSMTIGQ